MKIISGFRHPQKPEWNKALDNLKESAERLGHEILIADLPTIDPWIIKYEELFLTVCWKYKLLFLIEALKAHGDDLLWVDGDCLIAKSIDFNAAIGDADLAFTLRNLEARHETSNPERDGLINSGVIFIRNNVAAMKFLDRCRAHLLLSLYDQEAFNVHMLKYSEMEQHGEIIDADGTRVKMLDCREYNNFYFDASFLGSKIQHFKSNLGRSKYREIYGVSI